MLFARTGAENGDDIMKKQSMHAATGIMKQENDVQKERERRK